MNKLKDWFGSGSGKKNSLMEEVRHTKNNGKQRCANAEVVNYSWKHVWQLFTTVYNSKNVIFLFSLAVAMPFTIIQ
jgi:hypothetical protein